MPRLWKLGPRRSLLSSWTNAGSPSTVRYVPTARPTGTAVLPRTWLESRSPAAQGLYEGTVWDVNSFAGATPAARLKSALLAIYAGTVMGSDVIELDAFSTGAVYQDLTTPERPIDGITGLVTTRDPSGENLWITFRTKRHAELPPEGSRVRPYALNGTRTAGPDAGKFFMVEPASPIANRRAVGTPRLSGETNPYTGAPFTNPERASYYRFTGLETRAVQNMGTGVVVCFGNPAGGELSDPSQLSTDLTLDRCFVHGSPPLDMKAAVGLHCIRGIVVDSFVEDTGGAGVESQGIIMYAGPGPYKIVGNTVIGATETFMTGGAAPSFPGLIPSDIEFRRNDITKWPWWNPLDANYDGTAGQRTIKNLFEFKCSQYTLIEGNIFRNIWKSGQSGAAFLLKSFNDNGATSPEALTIKATDFVVRYNSVQHATNMFAMAAAPFLPIAEYLSRAFIEHNTGLDIGTPWTYPASGTADSQTYGAFFTNSGPVHDQDVQYNTCINAIRGIFSTGSAQNVRGGFRGNVFAFGSSSLFGGIQDDGTVSNTAMGTGSFNYFWPDSEWVDNVIFGVPSAKVSAFDSTNGNAVLTSQDAVGFVDPANGNYRISGAYGGLGADWDAVEAYIAGVQDSAVPGPS